MRNSRLLTTMVLMFTAFASAQTPSSLPADVFSSWRQSLNDAADRTLAAAVADRPWMKFDPNGSESGVMGTPAMPPAARLHAAMGRVQQLRPMVEPILREEGVPAELSGVMLVESGGLLTVSSPKGARGLWQLMPETARGYGLIVTSERDDRIDLARSTRAAARYLRDLYGRFGDWQLALAAYNVGEKRVERALSSAQGRTFSAIRGILPFETRNYVPAVANAIAALGIPPGSAFLNHGARASTKRFVYATADSNHFGPPLTNQ